MRIFRSKSFHPRIFRHGGPHPWRVAKKPPLTATPRGESKRFSQKKVGRYYRAQAVSGTVPTPVSHN
jgi:hypothetical protein